MWLKQKLAWLLIVLMSIESFAAVVGDNDGAAFITKAEFESLKNDFQTQINNYNSSLDNKIDGAIATYLGGVSMASKKEIKPYVSNYNEIRWMHGPYMYYIKRSLNHFVETTGICDSSTDNRAWQILDVENRRQSCGDQEFWFHDTLAARTGRVHITFRLSRYQDSPKNWGYGQHADMEPSLNNAANLTHRGPSIYLVADRMDDGKWCIRSTDSVIMAELGIRDELQVYPHHGVSGSFFAGQDPRTLTLNGYLWNGKEPFSIDGAPATEKDFIHYTISSLSQTTNGTNRTIHTIESKPQLKDNPQIWQTWSSDKVFIQYDDGTSCMPLHTGCGFKINQPAVDPTTGARFNGYRSQNDAKYIDSRWDTEKQNKCDNENLRLSMFGADVAGFINLSPHIKVINDFTFIDLSDSPNYLQMSVWPGNGQVAGMAPSDRIAHHFADTTLAHGTTIASSYSRNQIEREYWNTPTDITIPLFHRASWSNLCSAAFKNRGNNNPLTKGGGLPILIDADDNGTLTLSFDYEENSKTDTSLVTLTADNKIKTYFKNKNFLDTTGTFYSGYLNDATTGTTTILNGTEWTGKKVKVRIEVKKGEDVWMRLDPLTADGIYCNMSNYKCIYETE